MKHIYSGIRGEKREIGFLVARNRSTRTLGLQLCELSLLLTILVQVCINLFETSRYFFFCLCKLQNFIRAITIFFPTLDIGKRMHD